MNTSPHLISVKSYWDWLPWEIQEYFVLLAQYQHAVDRVKNCWLTVYVDIVKYAKLKEAWGLGHVKVVQYKCKWWFCHFYNPFHTKIILTYIDVYHRKKQWYLRNIDLSDMDELLKRVAEDKKYLRDSDKLELDMS